MSWGLIECSGRASQSWSSSLEDVSGMLGAPAWATDEISSYKEAQFLSSLKGAVFRQKGTLSSVNTE